MVIFFGSLILALSSISVILFKINTIIDYFILGALYGIGFGFYWANRNYLTQQETNHASRNYFFGLSFSTTTIISLIITLASGWLIVFGLSYVALMIFGVTLIFYRWIKGVYLKLPDYQYWKIIYHSSNRKMENKKNDSLGNRFV